MPVRVVLVLAAAIVTAACTSSRPVGEELVHVHGLDVDPGDGTLFAATHTGLFRVVDGRPERVGERLHDLMGFTIEGPGEFLASGHPDLRDASLQRPDAPPLLGLVTSRDGENWEPRSLLGEVDFHALETADGRVYGVDSSTGALLVSEDRETWEQRSSVGLVDVAVSPDDPELLVGTTGEEVRLSSDGGRTWAVVSPEPVVTLVWPEQGPVGLAAGGSVLAAGVDGSSWRKVGTLAGEPEALDAHEGVLHAAVAERGILRSDDGGASWDPAVS